LWFFFFVLVCRCISVMWCVGEKGIASMAFYYFPSSPSAILLVVWAVVAVGRCWWGGGCNFLRAVSRKRDKLIFVVSLGSSFWNSIFVYKLFSMTLCLASTSPHFKLKLSQCSSAASDIVIISSSRSCLSFCLRPKWSKFTSWSQSQCLVFLCGDLLFWGTFYPSPRQPSTPHKVSRA
jgi:hypothetical protein